MKKFRVAVVQMKVKQYDPEANLRRAASFIRSASRKHCDVIAFPEDFLAGPIERRRDLDDTKHAYRDRFIRLAADNGIDIVAGSVIERQGEKRYNTSYYVDMNGKVLSRYRKMNLWTKERGYFKSGDRVSVFRTRYGKVGVAICWDLAFEDVFKEMKKRGVEIVFCPSWWSREDREPLLRYNINVENDVVNALCTCRAFENGVVLVYCNAAGIATFGKSNQYVSHLIGQSQVDLPAIGVVKRLGNGKEAMLIVDIDSGKLLKDFEAYYKIRSSLLDH